MGALRDRHGKRRRYLTEAHLTILRIDGAVPHDALLEMTVDEAVDEWDAFVAYAERREKAARAAQEAARTARPPQRR